MGNDEARDEKGIFGNGELFKSPNLMRPFLEQRVDNVGSFIVREKKNNKLHDINQIRTDWHSFCYATEQTEADRVKVLNFSGPPQ